MSLFRVSLCYGVERWDQTEVPPSADDIVLLYIDGIDGSGFLRVALLIGASDELGWNFRWMNYGCA
jgi:hypothetical protein